MFFRHAINELSSVPPDELEYTLEAAVREAIDDNTFRKVNRCSYSVSTADVSNHLLHGPGYSLGQWIASQFFTNILICYGNQTLSPLLSLAIGLYEDIGHHKYWEELPGGTKREF